MQPYGPLLDRRAAAGGAEPTRTRRPDRPPRRGRGGHRRGDRGRRRGRDGRVRDGRHGRVHRDRDFTTLSEEDLQKGELQFGLPAALIVLLLVFGAVVAGLVPVLVALVAIIVSLGLTALLGQAFDLSVFVVNMISGMGLALGIDYSLFVVSAIARNGASEARSSSPSRRWARRRAAPCCSAARLSSSRWSGWCSSRTRSSAASPPGRSWSGSSRCSRRSRCCPPCSP